jgi:hypothetical protein
VRGLDVSCQPLVLPVEDPRQVQKSRLPTRQDAVKGRMHRLFAGYPESASIAVEMRRIDSEVFVPIPTSRTGRLNIRIGFVRRDFANRIDFDLWIEVFGGFRGWGDDVGNGRR